VTVKEKPIVALTGGIVTEASELTYPEGTTTNELNATIERDGSRRRRLGFNFELNNQFLSVPSKQITKTSVWRNVGNISGRTNVVVQIGSTIYFYNVDPGQPLSSGLLSYTINLNSYLAPAASGVASKIDTTSVRGRLVIVSSDINPILVSFDGTNYSDQEIEISVRDFVWLGDRSTYTTDGPFPPPDTRLYDTYNSGWTNNPYTTYTSTVNASPALTHQWFAGKDSNGLFNITSWQRIYAGTSIITNGRFVVNLWNRDRATVSGIGNTSLNTTEDARFSCVETFAGRVWYSGINGSTDDNGSKVFFSRVIVDDVRDIGNLYQVNDPTSEQLSDLLDTDGGFISIPEAYQIRRLYAIGPYLIVFASNGIWRISGVDDVFRANDYVVSKVSNVGLEYPDSLVESDSKPYWWSRFGIHTLEADQTMNVREVNISINSVQTLWLEIDNKETVTGAFDAVNKKVFWLYGEDHTKKNDILIFDEVLEAFHRYRISDKNFLFTPVVTDLVFIREAFSPDEEQDVVLSDLTNVTASGQQVTVKEPHLRKFKPELFFLTYFSPEGYSFSKFRDTNFLDWGDTEYETFLDIAYDFSGLMQTRKNIVYIDSFFKRTEKGWILDNLGNYTLSYPSGCLVSCSWDFSEKRLSEQQAYRLPPMIPSAPDLRLDFDRSAIRTRMRLRGSGRVVRIRWRSEGNKDFHLLGWNVVTHTRDTL